MPKRQSRTDSLAIGPPFETIHSVRPGMLLLPNRRRGKSSWFLNARASAVVLKVPIDLLLQKRCREDTDGARRFGAGSAACDSAARRTETCDGRGKARDQNGAPDRRRATSCCQRCDECSERDERDQ